MRKRWTNPKVLFLLGSLTRCNGFGAYVETRVRKAPTNAPTDPLVVRLLFAA